MPFCYAGFDEGAESGGVEVGVGGVESAGSVGGIGCSGGGGRKGKSCRAG